MHIITKVNNRTATRSRGPRMALASRSKPKPFPALPPPSTAPAPSRELLEMRARVGALESELKGFVSHLVDMEHSETPRRYSPPLPDRVLPAHLASLPSIELEQMRVDAADVHSELCECARRLAEIEAREAVVDLTVGE